MLYPVNSDHTSTGGIITGGETWVYGMDMQTSQQNGGEKISWNQKIHVKVAQNSRRISLFSSKFQRQAHTQGGFGASKIAIFVEEKFLDFKRFLIISKPTDRYGFIN